MQTRDPYYGNLLAGLLLSAPSWVVRRVETIEILDDEAVRVEVSMDFNLTGSGFAEEYVELLEEGLLPEGLVPIGLLEKRPLYSFDLLGPDGKPASLLSQVETTPLAVDALMHVAAGVTNGETADLVRAAVRGIVDAPSKVARKRLADFGRNGESHAEAIAAGRLMENASFNYLLIALSEKFVAIAVLPPAVELDKRNIIKYAYVSRLEWDDFVLLSRMGWRPASIKVALPLVPMTGSYHVDIEAPDQLEIRSACILQDGRADLTGSAESGKLPRAHVHISGKNFTDNASYELRLRLGPKRRGLVRTSLLATALPVAVTLLIFIAHARIATRLETTTAPLLVAIPSLVAANASRPTEHALASRLYFGLRLVLLTSAACCWVDAAAITLDASRHVLAEISLATFVVSGACWIVCLVAFVCATKRPSWFPGGSQGERA